MPWSTASPAATRRSGSRHPCCRQVAIIVSTPCKSAARLAYGVDPDGTIAVLTQDAVLRDPAVFRRNKESWGNPDRRPRSASIQADAALFLALGLLPGRVNLPPLFVDQY